MQTLDLSVTLPDGPVDVKVGKVDWIALEEEFPEFSLLGLSSMTALKYTHLCFLGWHAAFRKGATKMTWTEFRFSDDTDLEFKGAEEVVPFDEGATAGDS